MLRLARREALLLANPPRIHSNAHPLLYGEAEWQRSELVWASGIDPAFFGGMVGLFVVAAVSLRAYARLAAERQPIR